MNYQKKTHLEAIMMMGTKTKQFMKKALLVGAFTFASMAPLCAQKLDTAKVAPKNDTALVQKQDTAKIAQKKKTFVLQPKVIARVYGSAREPAIGAGLEVSKDIGNASIGASGTLAFDGQRLLVEESGAWIGVPAGKSVYLVGYAYTDRFFNVAVKDPAFGIAVKYGMFKAGFEKGRDFSCQYDKVIFPNGVSLGATALFWGDKIGYDAPIGKLQRYGVCAGMDSKIFKMPIKVEIMYTRPSGAGQNGLQVRLTLMP
ncbi:MAG: hypothetical protein NTX79_03300 [Candidatus Micrarchaeota archaeon]|nr:hypothetical protein [Candidatus Micrarchaeota archaeon]